MTVSAGTDQTTSSMRPEYSQSGQRCALAFDARNQKAKAKIVTIVGSTIASMIASESIRMVFSAAPIGPCGSRIFIAEPENGTRHDGAAARTFRGLRISWIALPRTVATTARSREPSSQSLELRNHRD